MYNHQSLERIMFYAVLFTFADCCKFWRHLLSKRDFGGKLEALNFVAVSSDLLSTDVGGPSHAGLADGAVTSCCLLKIRSSKPV